MAKRATGRRKTRKAKGGLIGRFLAWFFGWALLKQALRWALWVVVVAVALVVGLVALFSVMAPPTTPYIVAERFRLDTMPRAAQVYGPEDDAWLLEDE